MKLTSYDRSKRLHRLLMGLGAPLFIGGTLFVLGITVDRISTPRDLFSIETISELPGFVVIAMIGAPIVMGIQSIAYSLIMEFFCRSRVRKRAPFLGVSSALGALSGAVIEDATFLIPLGAVTGWLVGWLLYQPAAEARPAGDDPAG